MKAIEIAKDIIDEAKIKSIAIANTQLGVGFNEKFVIHLQFKLFINIMKRMMKKTVRMYFLCNFSLLN